MREINLIIITTLIATLIWVGVEARDISEEIFVGEELLEIATPIDGTIDTNYLIRLE